MCCFMHTLSTLVDVEIGSLANIPRPWIGDLSTLYLGISPIFERGLDYERGWVSVMVSWELL